ALRRASEDRRDRGRAGGGTAESVVRSRRDAFGRAAPDASRARPSAVDLPFAAQARWSLHPRRYRAAAFCSAGRRAGAAALRRRQRLLLGGGVRAGADLRVGLSAPEEDGGTVTLYRGGDTRAPAGGPLQPRARPPRHQTLHL